MLRDEFPSVRFIQSHYNLGFAAANNCGAAAAVGDCLLFLNPDTELVGAAIDSLWTSSRHLPDAGILGARLLNADGSVQTSCIQAFPTVLNQVLDSEFLRARWPRSRLWGTSALYAGGHEPREIEGVSGACMLVGRSTFDGVGRFSEDYFMYAEDMDLSYKVRSRGRRNYYVPGATIIHYGGSSSDKAVSTFAAVMMPEAIWRFISKTQGRVYGSAYRAAMLIAAIGRLCILAAMRLVSSGGESWDGPSRKWRAVLRWSLRLDDVVRQYYPRDRNPSYVR
jgi:GT2 family glycosyltransferase